MRGLTIALAALALSGCSFVYSNDSAFNNRTSTSGSTTEGDSGTDSSASSASGSTSSGSSASSTGSNASSTASTSSTGTGASSTSSSGASSASSASTGESSGSSGSSGTTGAPTGPQLVLPNSDTQVWTVLAEDSNQVALAATNPSDQPDPWITSFDSRGNGGSLIGVSCGANTLPRALNIDAAYDTLIGEDESSGEISICISAGGHVHPAPFTVPGRQVVDGVVFGGADQFITRTDGGAPQLWSFYRADSGYTSASLSIGALDPEQLVADPANASDAFVLGSSSSSLAESAVYQLGSGAPFAVLDGGAVSLVAMDIDPSSGTAYLGGADSDGSLVVTAQTSGGTWSNATVQRASGATVESISARNGNYAYLYLASDGGLGVFRSVLPGPQTDDLALPGGPVSFPPGDPNLHSGRQIAITSSGSVFFITDDGGWFWPAP